MTVLLGTVCIALFLACLFLLTAGRRAYRQGYQDGLEDMHAKLADEFLPRSIRATLDGE